MRVVYGGDANYGSCNTGLNNVTVQKRNTYPRLLFQRGDISRQPNAITLGESIDLFGVIEDEFLSPVPGPPVTGYVGFERGNSYTVKTLSPTASTVPLSSSATVPFSALQVGPFTVRLRYEGDANYAASEILVNGQINPANTLTRISSNRLNLTLGQSATVSATVTALRFPFRDRRPV